MALMTLAEADRLRAIAGRRAVDQFVSFQRSRHAQRREGDEMACSCGKRWPIGEDHP